MLLRAWVTRIRSSGSQDGLTLQHGNCRSIKKLFRPKPAVFSCVQWRLKYDSPRILWQQTLARAEGMTEHCLCESLSRVHTARAPRARKIRPMRFLSASRYIGFIPEQPGAEHPGTRKIVLWPFKTRSITQS
jgi:hypothetical protein